MSAIASGSDSRKSGPDQQVAEVPVKGMDCADCVKTVRGAIAELPGVDSVDVYLAGERARVSYDPNLTTLDDVRQAVHGVGYECPLPGSGGDGINATEDSDVVRTGAQGGPDIAGRAMRIMGMVFGAVLFAVVVGEWLGLFEVLTERVPLWLGAAVVLAFGFRIFRNVVRNLLRGRVIAHTLMSTGALAALAVGEWATAALVVFFMRVGDYAESFTTDRARQSLRGLSEMSPKQARVVRNGAEEQVPVEQVRVGDTVVVRPGEAVPVDGQVVGGSATIDQSAITGESMPVDAAPGTPVYAATIAQLGSLRIEAREVGKDTTFARILQKVEEAEANRGETERLADRFSAWYLPLVAAIALATYLLSGDLLAAVAVTVVACSCAFALATPVAMLASIGVAARRGLLIKGGKYIEALAKADVLLLDKTGTLTYGRPRLTAVIPMRELGEDELLRLVASAERDSEHPLARSLVEAARERGLEPQGPDRFEALPGQGVRAEVGGRSVEVGSPRLLREAEVPERARQLEEEGNTVLFVLVDGELAGLLATADSLRHEVPKALQDIRELGIGRIELLTGDNSRTAHAIASELGIDYRAQLLPEEKLERVEELQAQGNTVVMIGDGVNDAPALVQANVGIAMGAAGSDIAIESAHVALMRDDWSRVPELFEIAGRTMGVVRLNIGFTAVYNLVGISLAALGFLPPIFAAALQSVPDLGIMGNSARLLRSRSRPPASAPPGHAQAVPQS